MYRIIWYEGRRGPARATKPHFTSRADAEKCLKFFQRTLPQHSFRVLWLEPEKEPEKVAPEG